MIEQRKDKTEDKNIDLVARTAQLIIDERAVGLAADYLQTHFQAEVSTEGNGTATFIHQYVSELYQLHEQRSETEKQLQRLLYHTDVTDIKTAITVGLACDEFCIFSPYGQQLLNSLTDVPPPDTDLKQKVHALGDEARAYLSKKQVTLNISELPGELVQHETYGEAVTKCAFVRMDNENRMREAQIRYEELTREYNKNTVRAALLLAVTREPIGEDEYALLWELIYSKLSLQPAEVIAASNPEENPEPDGKYVYPKLPKYSPENPQQYLQALAGMLLASVSEFQDLRNGNPYPQGYKVEYADRYLEESNLSEANRTTRILFPDKKPSHPLPEADFIIAAIIGHYRKTKQLDSNTEMQQFFQYLRKFSLIFYSKYCKENALTATPLADVAQNLNEYLKQNHGLLVSEFSKIMGGTS